MVAGATRKASEMRAASSPRTACRIRGLRTCSATAGWAQANISRSRSSGTVPGGVVPLQALLHHPRDLGQRARRGVPSSRGVDEVAAGGGDQPRLGPGGDAALGPGPQRRHEGVAQRVLGGGQVARDRGEVGDQAPVRRAGDLLHGAGDRRGLLHAARTHAAAAPAGAPRPRRTPPRGSAPPRPGPCRGRAPRRRSSRPAAPWSRRTGRPARDVVRHAHAAWSPSTEAGARRRPAGHRPRSAPRGSRSTSSSTPRCARGAPAPRRPTRPRRPG